jgi:hypothetical protein
MPHGDQTAPGQGRQNLEEEPLMSKRIRQPRANHRKAIRPGVAVLPEQLDARARYAPPYRPDYKRNVERFFKLQSFPEKATKKRPQERTKSVLKPSDFMALFEETRRRVDDQRRDHQRTLRKVRSSAHKKN